MFECLSCLFLSLCVCVWLQSNCRTALLNFQLSIVTCKIDSFTKIQESNNISLSFFVPLSPLSFTILIQYCWMRFLFDFPAATNIFMNTGIVISNHMAYMADIVTVSLCSLPRKMFIKCLKRYFVSVFMFFFCCCFWSTAVTKFKSVLLYIIGMDWNGMKWIGLAAPVFDTNAAYQSQQCKSMKILFEICKCCACFDYGK